MNITPEERQIGRDNYYDAVTAMDAFGPNMSRRGFLAGAAAASIAGGAGLGAMYFGYGKVADPVRIGVIGTGDEGNVLIGACNPNYVTVKAIADIRPSSIHRAFNGDWRSPAALAARKAGKRVLVLEKTDLVGGTTAISGGVMWIPANRYMAEAGINTASLAAHAPSLVAQLLAR